MLQTVPKLLGGKVVRTAYGPTFTIVDDGHVDSDRMRGDIEDFIFEFYLDIVKRIVDIAKLQGGDSTDNFWLEFRLEKQIEIPI